jgi:hypothetical protein
MPDPRNPPLVAGERRGGVRIPTEEEHASLYWYSGRAHLEFNRKLRCGADLSPKEIVHMKNIDRAIAHQPLTVEDSALVRRVRMTRKAYLAELRNGPHRSYFSTSVDPVDQREFGETEISIELPGGSRVLDMTGDRMAETGDFPHTRRVRQKEMLFGRNAVFRVVAEGGAGGPIRVRFVGYDG